MMGVVILFFLTLVPLADDPSTPRLEIQASRLALSQGEPFELTLHRFWPSEARVSDVNENAFLPLLVQHQRTERSTRAGWTQEVQVYQAHAFGLDECSLAPIEMTVTLGKGDETRTEVVRSAPIRFEIGRLLDPVHPGDPELPGELRGSPGAWVMPLILGMGGLAIVVGMGWLVRRRRSQSDPQDPYAAIEARLNALESQPQSSPEFLSQSFDQLTVIVRETLGVGQDPTLIQAKSWEEIIAETKGSKRWCSDDIDTCRELFVSHERAMFSDGEVSADDFDRFLTWARTRVAAIRQPETISQDDSV